MANNLHFIQVMSQCAKSETRRQLNIKLACIGIVAVSFGCYCYYINVQQFEKIKRLTQESNALSDAVSQRDWEIRVLQNQLQKSQEIIKQQAEMLSEKA